MSEQKMIQMPEVVAQELLNYLAKRPYAEVFKLIAAMQQLSKAIEAQPEVKEEAQQQAE